MTFALAAAPPRRTGRLAGLGAARPPHAVAGSRLVERFGKSSEWLQVRTGITQLTRLAEGETLFDLALSAGKQALVDAERAPEDVDVVVVATCSAPATDASPLSHRVAAALNPRAVAFDVNAVCAGFCYGLSIANGFVETDVAETVLVIGADQMSRIIDSADLGTSILFADGAGAAVVTSAPDTEQGIGAPAWTSDGSPPSVGLLEIPVGDTAMRMQGSQVFRWAVEEVHKVAAAAMEKAGVGPEDIDVFVPHQANLRIIEAIRKRLKLERATTATDITETGNTSAASIPLALEQLRRSGELRSGQVALLAGFGAGLTIAAQVVRLP